MKELLERDCCEDIDGLTVDGLNVDGPGDNEGLTVTVSSVIGLEGVSNVIGNEGNEGVVAMGDAGVVVCPWQPPLLIKTSSMAKSPR